MNFARQMVSVGVFALLLGTEGISVGFALDQPLPPDLTSPLPSDTIFGEQNYPDRTDPKGNLHKNKPIFLGESLETTYDPFLTFGGLDRTDTACQYYVTIGAVASCGVTSNGTLRGAFISPTTFQAWKNEVGIDNPGTPTHRARFINQVDLNLTREHHMVFYGRGTGSGLGGCRALDNGPNAPMHICAAAYVCNHKGPFPTMRDPTGLFPPQDEIDELINDAQQNPQNTIACVAMEFSTRGPRGQPPSPKPFTKFLIFGPDGALWSTIDLDGRGPKGVPHVCTACHGGKFDYDLTTFQATQRPPGDLGAHFLPFDIANFAFSSHSTPDQQEKKIFNLNLDVYNIERDRWTKDPTTGSVIDGFGSFSIQELIEGWYDGDMTPSNIAPRLNRNYIAPSWKADPINSDAYLKHSSAYLKAYSHSCRTCHVAMDQFPAEENPTVISNAKAQVCDQHSTSRPMPNAKVIFDRFWLSLDHTVSPPDVADQPLYLAQLFANPACPKPAP
jgi:hypothetical protein